MKIAILGCGAYGLALATQFVKNKKNEVIVYTKFPNEKEEVMHLHKREQILKGVELPPLVVTLSLEEALHDAKFIVFAVPFFALEATLQEIKPYVEKEAILVFASKGLRKTDGKTAPELYGESSLKNDLIVLSGPTFASDLAKQAPVILTLASESKDALSIFASCFRKPVTLEFSTDVLGVSYCGAIKNIFAILHGYLVGKKVPSSTQAFVLYRCLKQLASFLEMCNCDKETILTAAGVGDFYMTAESMESRNHTFGYLLATTSSIEVKEYLEKTTVEGVSTLSSCLALLERMQKEIPIFSHLSQMIAGKPYTIEDLLKGLE